MLCRDRRVDGAPAGIGCTNLGKVFPSDVPRGVEIGVHHVSAFAALECRLRLAIPTMRVRTPSTTLTRVPRIDNLNLAAQIFGLVLDKGAKLRETPRVMPPPMLATALLCTGTNLREILQDDNAAGTHALNDPLAQNVIAVAPKPFADMADFFQVPLCRLRAFGLQPANKPEIPLICFFPPSLAEEHRVRGNGGAIDSKVYAHDVSVSGKRGLLNTQNDVEMPTGFVLNQVGAIEARCARDALTPLFVRAERHDDAAFGCRETNDPFRDIDAMRTGVVANAPTHCLRSRHAFSLTLQRKCRAQGLRRLHARGDNELCGKRRIRRTQVVVRRLVQFDAVFDAVVPPMTGNGIEALARSRKRIRQELFLVGIHRKLDANRSLHASYIQRFCQNFNRRTRYAPAPPPRPEGRGFRREGN